MNLRIPALQHLIVECHEGVAYIELDSFLSTIRRKRGLQEKDIRKDNFLRDNKASVTEINSHKYIQVAGIIHHVFGHRNKLKFYQTVCGQIEARLGVPQAVDTHTVLSLYHHIANFDILPTPALEDHVLQNIQLRPSPTLVSHHKENFSDKEWQKICLFEWHFSQLPEVCHLGYEDQLLRRFQYLDTLKSTKDVAKHLAIQTAITINRRSGRSALANNGQLLVTANGTEHSLGRLEKDIKNEASKTFPGFDNPFVVVTCNRTCQSKHQHFGAHIYMEKTSSMTDIDGQHIALVACSVLAKVHSLHCLSTSFFKVASFDSYRSANGQVGHFHLHDDIYDGKLEDSLVLSWSPSCDEVVVDDDASIPCTACSRKQSSDEPLHWKSFDLEKEWYTDVPLEVQFLLDSFISKTTISRTQEIQRFMKGKHV